MKEDEQIHKIIIKKLDSIENQTIKTNGRVTNLEQEMVGAKKDIAEALKIISGHSTIISYYKQEADKAKDNLIEEQAEKIEAFEKAEKDRNKKLMYFLGMVVLFILISLGFVKEDLIKFIL